jgi:hypothetical protein
VAKVTGFDNEKYLKEQAAAIGLPGKNCVNITGEGGSLSRSPSLS